MKKLLAIAALLLASSAAQAQYTFEYGGRTIRVDPDRGTVQIPGVYDNTGRSKAKRSRNDDADRDRPPRKPSPQEAKTDTKTDPKTDPQTAPEAPPLPDVPLMWERHSERRWPGYLLAPSKTTTYAVVGAAQGSRAGAR